jgi:hypothetical protein
MVETAAHLTDQVLPRVPLRQWVLSLPKRVRWFLRQRPETVSPVLRVFLRAAASRMELVEAAGAPSPATRSERYAWAMLLARIYELLPLICSCCGRAMRLMSFVTEAASVRRNLAHVGEDTQPPALAPSRAPPMGEFAWDQKETDDDDQRTAWSEEPWYTRRTLAGGKGVCPPSALSGAAWFPRSQGRKRDETGCQSRTRENPRMATWFPAARASARLENDPEGIFRAQSSVMRFVFPIRPWWRAQAESKRKIDGVQKLGAWR